MEGVGFLLGFGIAFLVNALVVWLGMVITRLSTTLPGLIAIITGMTLPGILIPGFVGGLIGTIAFWVLVLKFSDADGFIDVLLLVVVTNVVSMFLLASILVGAVNYLRGQGSLEVGTDSVTIERQIQEESATGVGGLDSVTQSNSPYDALKDQLDPETLAEIEREVGG